jgi:hypothetical protein
MLHTLSLGSYCSPSTAACLASSNLFRPIRARAFLRKSASDPEDTLTPLNPLPRPLTVPSRSNTALNRGSTTWCHVRHVRDIPVVSSCPGSLQSNDRLCICQRIDPAHQLCCIPHQIRPYSSCLEMRLDGRTIPRPTQTPHSDYKARYSSLPVPKLLAPMEDGRGPCLLIASRRGWPWGSCWL